MNNYSAIRLAARRLKSRAPGSEARLRGLYPAIADYLLKNHKPRALGSEARLRGLPWFARPTGWFIMIPLAADSPGGENRGLWKSLARRLMEFEKLFRYPLVRPAAEAAGSCCEARLRGLHWAIPDYFLKLHKSRAPGSEARLRGLTGV